MYKDELIDGEYFVTEKNAESFIKDDFKNEAELVSFVESNIGLFCKDFLNVELKSYKREFCISGENRRKFKGNRRVDFIIETKCGQTIVVECKCPRYVSEVSAGVAQLLGYICLFESYERKVDRFVLLSTKMDSVSIMMIKKFNLPIEFYLTDKDRHLRLIGDK